MRERCGILRNTAALCRTRTAATLLALSAFAAGAANLPPLPAGAAPDPPQTPPPLAPPPAPAGDETIPQAHAVSRYQSIWENSPFELDAPPSASPASESPLAEDYALTGITKIRGRTVVTLLDKKTGTSFDLREGEPRNELRLLGVSVNPDPMLTEVRLAKGSLTGSVGYDKKSLAAPPTRPAQAVAAGHPFPIPGQAPPGAMGTLPGQPPPTHAIVRRRTLPAVANPPQPVLPTPPIPVPPVPAEASEALPPVNVPGQPEIPLPRQPQRP